MVYIKTDKGFEKAMKKLTDLEKQSLVKVMAQISEASYRRGAQQGIACVQAVARREEDWQGYKRYAGHRKVIRRLLGDQAAIADWRYGKPLSQSIGFDGPLRSSVDLLDREYGITLRKAGLTIPKALEHWGLRRNRKNAWA